uniref:Uncharacterized protein n=1 Tax=Arabidopsis thaliana TaxID=3702 RepID=Q0WLV1_ARATH|nr:hypothetical protein [Arabidopsis thaliana]
MTSMSLKTSQIPPLLPSSCSISLPPENSNPCNHNNNNRKKPGKTHQTPFSCYQNVAFNMKILRDKGLVFVPPMPCIED